MCSFIMLKPIGESKIVLVCSAAMLSPSEVIALLLRQDYINVTCVGPDRLGIIKQLGMPGGI
jgi:hypothetical protein